MRVYGFQVGDSAIAALNRALDHELNDPRGFTWYNHVAARAIVHEGFPELYHRNARIAAVAACRLLAQRAKSGTVKHIGAGKWQRVGE